MIIKYKKNSDPESMYQTAYPSQEVTWKKEWYKPIYKFFSTNLYFAIPEMEPASLSMEILDIDAGIVYDFIDANREGIFWTLENQKGIIVHNRIFKDQTPFYLRISSQYAGRIPVKLTAEDKKGNTVIFFIYAISKKLIQSSSWTKKGSTNPIKM